MQKEALYDLFSLQGKVALVTGASGGIGSAIAQAYAAAGAHVALNGRSASKLEAVARRIADDDGQATPFASDISDVDSHAALLNAIVAQLGGLDILVNCAGINRRMPIEEVTPAVYDEITATNVRALYFLSQAAARHFRARGGGKILHIGSVSSFTGLNDISVYGMGKGGIVQLTKTQALEWAPDNIQVNNLCPGFIATELTVPLWQPGPRRDWIMQHVPQQRPGTPEDLLGMALYLVAPASNFTTGQSIAVDGGFTAGSCW